MQMSKASLAQSHPDLAKEAHGWDPQDFTSGSNAKKAWRCSKDHIFEASIGQRARKDGPTTCPFCSGQKVLAGFNDLASTHPALAKQADGWDPRTVSAGSRKRLSWICPKGHSFESEVRNGTASKSEYFCPICNGMQVLIGFNDLATTDPDVAKEADGWDPTTVTRGSNKKRSFRCPNGHLYTVAVAVRAVSGHGCRICKNQVCVIGFNDLATAYPELANQADGWDPKTVVFGSKSRRNWKCALGHTWSATVIGRTQGEKDCPFCTNMKTWTGFNDLATTHPHLVPEADGWDPTKIHAGTNKKLDWKCNRGHRWSATGSSRSGNETDCPVCLNRIVEVGFNDLATTHPDLAKEAHGWNPKTVVAGSNKKVKWICGKGHPWSAVIANRAMGRETGCPTCATTGFDPNIDAWLYLLEHPVWEMLQIGITNSPATRLKKHQKLGWVVLELRGPMDGLLTRGWEASILQMLRAQGAELAPSQVAGQFDGYTEAWMTSSHPVKSLTQLMEQVRAGEAGEGLELKS